MMKSCSRIYLSVMCVCLLLACARSEAETNLTLSILGEDISVQRYPAQGSQLVLYIAPSYGFNERGSTTAQALAGLGIEVWMVDLLESFFLPHSSESIRSFDGRYVAKIIEKAYSQSGKNITLLSSSFGAIPVLRGARQWQQNNSALKQAYLNGAILFSPELYRGIPALGIDPEFEPVTGATNIPIMIYQSALRNNRWHLDKTIEHLEINGAVVYRKILPDIVSYFYQIDEFPKTLETLRELPKEIPGIIKLLESTPTPLYVAKLEQTPQSDSKGLDVELREYKGNKSPLPLDLENINGERIVRKHYDGKVTVVNFWATWCPPCVQEIPMLNNLRDKMRDSNFELISINFGEEKSTINEFLKKVSVEFPVLLDEKGRISGAWNTVVLPSTFVIGPDGKFAYAVNAAIEWDSPDVVAALKKLAMR